MPGQLELREGWLVLYPHRRIVSGTVADWEELDIPNSVRWDVRGTDADERFLFEGVIGVRIRAGAGDDEIIGTRASPTGSTAVPGRTPSRRTAAATSARGPSTPAAATS